MAKKERYEELANTVPQLVGGVENVTFFTHCVTRLRFNVKDKSLVKLDEIEKINGVVGCQWSGEQLQIIIGQAVGDAYKLICDKTGLASQSSIDENLDGDKVKKKFSINAIFDTISGCIAPVLPLLIGGGMLKILILIGELTSLLEIGSSTHSVLTFIADTAFYFLPVFIGASAAKKFKANMFLGMLMGAILVHPQFIGMVDEGSKITLFGLPIYSTYYSYSIFTAIVSVYVMAKVERLAIKISPDIVRSITEPLITIIIMTPLLLCLLAPIGAMIGVYFTNAIVWLYDTTGFFSVALLAAIIPFVVMVGMHSAFDPYLIQTIAANGKEPIGGVVFFLNNFNQGAAAAGAALALKDKKMKSIAASSAITSIVGGVCEPAMYGVNLKLKLPMYASMIGSAVAGAYIGLMQVYIYAYPGNAALFGIPCFIGDDMMNVVHFMIGSLIGIIVTFVLTIIFLKRADKKRKA